MTADTEASELVQTLRDYDRMAGPPAFMYLNIAADRITQLEQGLRRIADARTAMDGGSIAECRRIAAKTLEPRT